MRIMIVGASGYLGEKISEMLSDHKLFCVIHKNDIKCASCTSIKITDLNSHMMRELGLDLIINLSNKYQRPNVSLSSIAEANLITPFRLLTYAVEASVPKWVNISTALPRGINYYSLAKDIFGDFASSICLLYPLQFINLKLELFYGPEQPLGNFIPNMIDALLHKESIELTSGRQFRDMVHIKDVLQAIICAMSYGQSGYHSFHIGSDDIHSIKETVDYLKELLGSSTFLNYGALPDRDPINYQVESEPLDQLGYSPVVTWKDGLREMVKRRVISN